ncbi:hypothetical protein NB693_25675 [Pantoea ananatis]|uniref:hypothetical protein n=1 Tax=Pantoea ananas TaxID=553 RepID=UPI00222115DD|nr:hypothetical protein [Pantoea ananatis]
MVATTVPTNACRPRTNGPRPSRPSWCLDDDAVVGRDTRTALAEAKRSPLVSEATHADHPFFNALRERMPRATDAQVAHTLQASKAEGIQGPQQLQAVTVQDKVAFVATQDVRV